MSAGASLAYPGSRTLGAWWRQLASHRPQAMWVGYPLFHHVAAPFLALRPQKLPPFELLVLKSLTFCAPADSRALVARLHLDAGLIVQVLQQLSRQGLVALMDGAGASVTAAGRHTALHGEYPRPRLEHRTLHFWHADWTSPSTSPPPSSFVHLPHPDRIAWLASPPTAFDVEDLRACVIQDNQWKERHGFPGEICEVLAKPAGTAVEALEEIVVVTPQRWFAVVVRTHTSTGAEFLGFAVNSRNWELVAAQPAFKLPDDPMGWFSPPQDAAAVRQAFVEWCQQRQIPAEESEQIGLKIEENRLMVETGALRERLHGGRGEFWLLAGAGTLRTALRMDFV